MSISYNGESSSLGKAPQTPFRIVAIVNCGSFGDYTMSLQTIGSVANFFDHARIAIIFKNNYGFKKKLNALLPDANFLPIPADQHLPSLELLNPIANSADMGGLKPWFDHGMERADLVLTETMLDPRFLSSYDHPGYLRIPTDQVEPLSAELRALGVDPDRWYCCLHYREPGYKYKPTGVNIRDSDPKNYEALTTYIIEKLGGQVVRLGHPEMAPFRARPGFVDISRLPDSETLQAFAVSRSRFLIAGPSGALPLGPALNVPVGHTDSTDFWGPVQAQDVVRTVDVITPSGDVVNQKALWDSNLGKLELLRRIGAGEPYQVIKNSPEILAQMANHMYEQTSNVTGWREPTPPITTNRPNSFLWPRQPRLRYQYLKV
jgi:putative glycosyltransferase (TIGR04372 family)